MINIFLAPLFVVGISITSFATAETKKEEISRLEAEAKDLKQAISGMDAFIKASKQNAGEIYLSPTRNKRPVSPYVKVSWLKKNGIWSKAGIKENDIITQIDEISTRIPTDAIALFDLPKKYGVHQIELLRNDKKITLNIKF